MDAPLSRPSSRLNLLDGPVGATLMRMTIPMVFGIASIMLFNVVDTMYVGRLGTRELAAMGFSFPVVFVVMNLLIGIGMGVSSAVSRAIGEGDKRLVRRLTTDSLLLAVLLVMMVGVAGIATIEPVFRSLGASEDLLPLIESYMVPWYAGVGLLAIPMVGNSAIRATGDTKWPSFVMMCAGGVNIVLDPFLIFGIGPFPMMGLRGAAIATLISWLVALVPALWILGKRGHLLEMSRPPLSAVVRSFRTILYVGIPASATNMLVPLSTGILTRLVAHHGAVAVAGYGAATRVEALSMIGTFALSTAVAPFAGQNYGAHRASRVRRALRLSVAASLAWGAAVALLCALAARPIAMLFNEDASVVRTTTSYLSILPISYGMLGGAIQVTAIFNALNQPFRSGILVVLRLFLFVVPLAYAGDRVGGLTGLFLGASLGNLLAGAVAYHAGSKFVDAYEGEATLAGPIEGEPETG